MPIKPENKKLYPKNWKWIRKKILKRAGWKCEFCGIDNYAEGVREGGVFYPLRDIYKMTGVEVVQRFGDIDIVERVIRIVLTIAHLDHDPTNNKPENLKALCQKCHNNYDLEHRLETRRKSSPQKSFEF